MSCETSEYELTYSEDERIALQIAQEKDEQLRQDAMEDATRKEKFKDIFENQTEALFNLVGLKFITFTHKKIKFSFTPSEIVECVSKKVIFYCRLKYRYKFWNITKRNSIPLTYKRKIYKLFYEQIDFIVTDNNVLNIITCMYENLVLWSKNEHRFRLEKYERIQATGEDLEIDTDDEEIFLNEKDRETLHRKREEIWNRMLPPPPFPERIPQRVQRHYY